MAPTKRHPKPTPEIIAQVRVMWVAGVPTTKIGAAFGHSHTWAANIAIRSHWSLPLKPQKFTRRCCDCWAHYESTVQPGEPIYKPHEKCKGRQAA